MSNSKKLKAVNVKKDKPKVELWHPGKDNIIPTYPYKITKNTLFSKI